MMKFSGISRCMPADQMYAVGCLNTGSMAVIPSGSEAALSDAELIRLAVADQDLWLEWRIAAEQQRIVQGDAVVEDPGARLQNGLLIEGVRRPEPGFNRVVVRVRKPTGRVDEQRVHGGVVVFRQIACRRGKPLARQDDAVVTRPARQ